MGTKASSGRMPGSVSVPSRQARLWAPCRPVLTTLAGRSLCGLRCCLAGHQGDEREAEGRSGHDDDKSHFHRMVQSGACGVEEDRRDPDRADR